MLVLGALRALGWRWTALVLAVGTVDGVGVLVGGFAAVIAAFGTLLSGLALYQRGRRDAAEQHEDDVTRELADSLARENELLRAKLAEESA